MEELDGFIELHPGLRELKQTNPNNDYVVYTLYDASELESKSLQIKITEDDYTFTREVQL